MGFGRELKAPKADGGVFASPSRETLPRLAAENHARLAAAKTKIDGVPLAAYRQAAQAEVVTLAKRYLRDCGEPLPALSSGPSVVATGHQPELFHPGVWVKNFALARLAAETNAVALNLVVDNDTLKSTHLRQPTWEGEQPNAVRLARVQFDAPAPEEPYETRCIVDPALFASFPERVAARTGNWGFTPILNEIWPSLVDQPGDVPIGVRFAAARRKIERRWGVHNFELPVSQLAETVAFRQFACQILRDLPRFAESYNRAIRSYRLANSVRSLNHPAPELSRRGSEWEAPFWRAGPHGRAKAYHTPGDAPRFENLRPRALTLTLFARLAFSDLFLHGIGGGKYDEVTDLILADYFKIEPPVFQVLSATFHLPLPQPEVLAHNARWHADQERDAYWNPQRHLADPTAPGIAELLTERAKLLAMPAATQRARRRRFRGLQTVCEQLRPFARPAIRHHAEAAELATRGEFDAAILTRRDYSWVLYPEAMLREVLTKFSQATPSR